MEGFVDSKGCYVGCRMHHESRKNGSASRDEVTFSVWIEIIGIIILVDLTMKFLGQLLKIDILRVVLEIPGYLGLLGFRTAAPHSVTPHFVT